MFNPFANVGNFDKNLLNVLKEIYEENTRGLLTFADLVTDAAQRGQKLHISSLSIIWKTDSMRGRFNTHGYAILLYTMCK